MPHTVQAAGEYIGVQGSQLAFLWAGRVVSHCRALSPWLCDGVHLGEQGWGNQERTDSWCVVSQDCSAKSSSSVRLFLFRSLLCERNIWALHCSHQVRLLGGCLGAAAHPTSPVSVSISVIQSRAEREHGDSCVPFLPPASPWWG